MADANHNAPERFPDRSVTIWEHCRNGTYIPIPAIRLSGLWIEEAGFEPSGRVHIEVWKGRLVITPIDEAELDPIKHGVRTYNPDTGLRRRIRPSKKPSPAPAQDAHEEHEDTENIENIEDTKAN